MVRRIGRIGDHRSDSPLPSDSNPQCAMVYARAHTRQSEDMVVGATFGCLFGQLVGLSPSLCAAAAMAAVFCGVTNCPVTSLLIAFELFGFEGMPYYLITIAVSYMLSGYFGLYNSQRIMYSKTQTQFINTKAH